MTDIQMTAPTKVCPHCGVQAQTTADRCPNCNKKYRKRRGGTVMKVMLGMALGGLLLIGGCVALIGGAANEAEKEMNAKGITRAEFDSVKTGTSQEDVEAQLGEPEDAQTFENEIPELDTRSSSSCIYYPESGKPLFEGQTFQLCFDDGKLTSKNAY